ncbi:MAG: transporter substrate-binding domain-containing protein [Motiliproteus sp.]
MLEYKDLVNFTREQIHTCGGSLLSKTHFLTTLLFALCFAFTTPSNATSQPTDSALQLSEAEQQWLQTHPKIRIGVDSGYAPYSFIQSDGSYQGIAMDFVSILSKQLSIEMEVVPNLSWPEIIKGAKNQNLDLVLTASKTKERVDFLNFTEIFLPTPLVIMTALEEQTITSDQRLSGKRVALVKGYSSSKRVLEQHPDINPVEVDTALDGLWAVATGKADAYVGVLGINVYLAHNNGISNIKVAAKYGDGLNGQRMASRKDWPELTTILDKALKALPPHQVTQIFANWLPLNINAPPSTSSIQLSTAERRWINDHPTIKLGVDPEFAPFEYIDEQGQYKGMCADYIQILNQRLGLNMQIIPDQSWAMAVAQARNAALDVLPCVGMTDGRKAYLKYSDPHLAFPRVLVGRIDGPQIQNLGQASKYTVAVQANSSHHGYLNDNSSIHPRLYPTAAEAMKAVSMGEADLFVGNEAASIFTIQEQKFNNLQINGAVSTEKQRLHFAVRKDWPELVSILNKGLASLSESEQASIRDRWVNLQFTTPKDDSQSKQHNLYAQVALMTLLVAAVALIVFQVWRKIGADPSGFNFSSARTRWITLTLVAFSSALVVSVAMVTLERVKDRILEDTVITLQTVLNVTKESLTSWARHNKQTVHHLATRSELIALSQQLLETPTSTSSAETRLDLQDYLNTEFNDLVHSGYYLLGPDGVILASDQIAEVGKPSAIAIASDPKYLQELSLGKDVFVPPIQTSPFSQSLASPPRLFFASPIYNDRGEYIAVIALSLNPAAEFSRLTLTGQIGRTGETYAFNNRATLLTHSRFRHQLIETGMIQPEQSDILAIEIRDPGRNLTTLAKAQPLSTSWPMTRMAAEATQGFSGHDLLGYRDYRGVEVLGAWLWDGALNIGLTTEIDRDEALNAYYIARRTTFSVLALMIAVALFASLFVLLIGEKANRALKRAKEQLEERVLARTAQLSESEQRLNLALKGGNLASWDEELRSNSVVINQRMADILGLSLTNIIDPLESWKNCLHYQDKERILKARQRLLDGLVPDQEQEYRVVTQHQRKRWLLANIAAVEWDEHNKPLRISGTIMDITTRKVMDEKLQQLNRAVDQSPATVLITDSDGRIEYVNRKFTEITGYEEDEVLGRNPSVFQSGQTPLETYKELWSTIKSGKEWSGEILNRRKGGELYWEAMLISPMKEATGEISHFVAVKEDITERRDLLNSVHAAKEQAVLANRAKSDFLANMSHEIRTPMNAIIGLSHLCLQTDLQPKQRDYISKLSRSSKSLLRIINDILDFSKIEAGKLELENICFDLENVLSDVATMTAYQAQEKGLEIVFARTPDVTRDLKGDPMRLGQILINLVNNAVKFTERGEIDVFVEKLSHDNHNTRLKFSVKDSGIGMDQEHQRRLFESFSQADTSTSRRYGGTGLGLAISKQLVKLMDGDIEVSSELGQGSTFSFTVSLGITEQTHPQRVPDKSLRGLSILVVDDNKLVRQSLSEILTAMTFSVATASSGEAALEILTGAKDKPFDLVFMDWNMPGINGVEATRQIRENATLPHPPTVIMITAYGREELMQEARTAGIKDFLVKPVTPSLLFDSIMNVFGGEVHADISQQQVEHLKPTLSDCSVLLVEDNEFNQLVAQELLQQSGIDVSCAKNGQQALDAMASQSFDAVLMDVQMPIMDGYETTRRIRQRPLWKHTPIIAMTAGAMEGDREKCLDAGMDDYLTKPIDPDLLYQTLSEWIGTQATKSRQPQTPLHSLQGIDTREGIRLIGGDEKIYHSMLRIFASKEHERMSNFRQALKSRDLSEARRQAHNLKGTAGTIGATEVQELAGTLEQMIVDNAELNDIKAYSERLTAPLEQVLKSLAALGDSPSFEQPETEVDIERELKQLQELVEKSDYMALDKASKLQPSIDPTLKDSLSKTIASLQQFNFEQASVDLAKLVEKSQGQPND